jgi:outer membrane protein assembly factor BamB
MWTDNELVDGVDRGTVSNEQVSDGETRTDSDETDATAQSSARAPGEGRYARRTILGASAGALAGLGLPATSSTAAAADNDGRATAGSVDGTGTPTPSEWPMDGYDLASTRYPPGSLAVTGTLSERWNFDVNVDHSSGDQYKNARLEFVSPTIADGKVIFGDASIAANQDYVHALDVETGEQVWRRTMSAMNTAVTVGDGRVYAAGNASFVMGIDLETGEELWRFGTGADVKSSPKFHDDLVYVGCNDGFFYAVNPERGFRVWKFDTSDDASGLEFYGAPVIANGVVYASTWAPAGGSAFVYGLDAEDGDEVFKTQLTYGSGSGAAPLAASEEHVYVPDANRGEILAYDLETHEIAWRKEGFEFGKRTGLAVADCRIVAVGTDGTVTGVSVSDGEWAWRSQTRGAIHAPPMVANGTVYVTDDEGWLYGFALVGGAKRFEYELGVTAKTTPRVVDGDLIATNENRVYRFGGDTTDYRISSLCSTREPTTAAPSTSETPTSEPTETETTAGAATTESSGTAGGGGSDETETSSGSSPGFGVTSVAAAIASGATLAVRRLRDDESE